MTKELKSVGLMFLCLTGITGFLYPLFITLLAHICFPWQAQGSLLMAQDKVIGSSLIGQYFVDDRYFWGRPSATAEYSYNPMASGGSNLAPSNPLLVVRVTKLIDRFAISQPAVPIPVDLVTASGSGLDPNITPAAAFYQIKRVAKARQISEASLIQLVREHILERTFGFMGEPRVNVLALNLALDQLGIEHAQSSN